MAELRQNTRSRYSSVLDNKSENAEELFSRIFRREFLEHFHVNFFPCEFAGQILEVFGPQNCAKTQIIHFLAADCLTAEVNDGRDGFSAKFVYVDLNYQFSILRFQEIIEGKIKKQKISESDKIRNCISRLRLIKCNTSLNLIKLLDQLQKELLMEQEICFIAIDCITCLLWLDQKNNLPAAVAESWAKISKLIERISQESNVCFVIVHAGEFAKKDCDFAVNREDGAFRISRRSKVFQFDRLHKETKEETFAITHVEKDASKDPLMKFCIAGSEVTVS